MKKGKAAIGCVLVSAVLCLSLGTSALAAANGAVGSGTRQDPLVSIAVSSSSESGNITTLKVTKTEWEEGDPASNVQEKYYCTEGEETVSSSAGALLSSSGWEQGVHSKKWVETSSVVVQLKPGGVSSACSALENSVSGSLASANQSVYDQTEITVINQRLVEASLTNLAYKGGSTVAQGGSLAVVQPVWSGTEQDVSAPRPSRFGQDSAVAPEGYNFRYTGWGQDSLYGAYHYVLGGAEGGAAAKEESDILNFLLSDTQNPDMPDHTTYCVDLSTKIINGSWYRIDNLESAGYYQNKDAAEHIRAIVNNGYWGTASGKGSLASFKQLLQTAQSSGAAGELLGLDFSAMTEGEAQAATQIAIWRYGNREGVGELQFEASNYNGASGWVAEEGDELAWARIDAAAAYLASLSEESGNTTVVITDRFIDNLSLTVGDLAKSSGGGNMYHARLSFALLTAPGANDSMVISILQDDVPVATVNMLPGQRDYVVENIVLAENSDVRFNLALSGVQYLENGVYIYTAEGGASQTLVGIAEGPMAVNAKLSMTLRLNVQDALVQAERTWRSEWGSGRAPAELILMPEVGIPETGDAPALLVAGMLAGGGLLALMVLLWRRRRG